MPEPVDVHQTIASFSPLQRELLAVRLGQLLPAATVPEVNYERLVAYVAPKSNQYLSAGQLRSFLKDQLPDYMVPSEFILLDKLPKTASGKIDRQALLELEAAPDQSKAAYTPPRNALEQAIAGFWQEVLPVNEIGRDDNFFDLGGHSLLLIQINRKLKEHCQRDITVVEMFRYPTISTLAEFLSGNRDESSADSLRKSRERAAARRETSNQQRALRQQYRSSIVR